MKKLLLILSSSVLALTVRGNTIVFDDLGPGGTYDQNSAYNVASFSPTASSLNWAAQFTAGASGFLATVDLGLTFDRAGPVNVFLYGDASGSPDSADQTFLGSGTPTSLFGTSNNSLVSFTVAGNIPVTMGSIYWLVLKPAVADESDFWNLSSPPRQGLVSSGLDDFGFPPGVNQVLPAFRITAFSTVPDSGSTFLLLLGLVATLIVLKRLVSDCGTVG